MYVFVDLLHSLQKYEVEYRDYPVKQSLGDSGVCLLDPVRETLKGTIGTIWRE